MTRKKNANPTPKTDDTQIPEFGGLSVDVKDSGDDPEPETEVLAVQITDNGEEQATIADPPEPKPKRGRKRKPTAPTSAPKRARGGKKTKATETSTSIKKAPTRARKANTAPKGKAASKSTKKLTKNATIAELADAFLAHLESQGKTEKTLFGYGLELKIAMGELGEATKIADLTERRIKAYFLSDRVTLRRNGQRKAEVGIAKTRRVFRMALAWAEATGVLTKATIPEMKKPDKSGK
jgi:hypothetical protein